MTSVFLAVSYSLSEKRNYHHKHVAFFPGKGIVGGGFHSFDRFYLAVSGADVDVSENQLLVRSGSFRRKFV